MEKLKISIDNKIRIQKLGLPNEVINILKERLIFSNPLFLRNQQYGRPNHDINPFLFCIWHDKDRDDLILARGFLPELIRIFHGHRIEFELLDSTQKVAEVDFGFQGFLYNYQRQAIEEIAEQKFGILVGTVGCGKKIVALKLAAMRKVPVLVIVRTKRQMYQWKDLAGRFLKLGHQGIGLIGDNHRDLDKKFTVAISLSLYKIMDQIKSQTGFVIVDQCDAANLKIFFKGVMPLDCPYMLGLANVPRRSDGLTRLMCAYLGPKLHHIKLVSKFEGLGKARPLVKIQNTEFQYNCQEDWPEMITTLCQDQERNHMIVTDILKEVADPSIRVLVISERVGHLENLLEMIEEAYGEGEIIAGETLESKQAEITRRFDRGKLQIILASFKSIHKLEITRANRLFVASPLKYGDHLTQIMGKLLGVGQRERPSVIYEYHDAPELLEVSLKRRFKFYRSMGAV